MEHTLLRTHLAGGGSSLPYISIGYYMQKEKGGKKGEGGGPDSMCNCVRTKWKAPYIRTSRPSQG